jgi:hypothetical protein
VCAPSFLAVFVAPRVAILCGRRICFSECNESIVNCVEGQLILVIPVPVVNKLLSNVSSELCSLVASIDVVWDKWKCYWKKRYFVARMS